MLWRERRVKHFPSPSSLPPSWEWDFPIYQHTTEQKYRKNNKEFISILIYSSFFIVYWACAVRANLFLYYSFIFNSPTKQQNWSEWMISDSMEFACSKNCCLFLGFCAFFVFSLLGEISIWDGGGFSTFFDLWMGFLGRILFCYWVLFWCLKAVLEICYFYRFLKWDLISFNLLIYET